MLKFISKLVGSKSDRDLKLLQPFVDAINSHTDAVAALSNDGLREKTAGFKKAVETATAELEAEKKALYEMVTPSSWQTLPFTMKWRGFTPRVAFQPPEWMWACPMGRWETPKWGT